jgi:hypothetical protein
LIFNAPLLAQKLCDIISDTVAEDTNYSLGFVVLPAFMFYKFGSSKKNGTS